MTTTVTCNRHPDLTPVMILYPKNHFQYAYWECTNCKRYLSHAKWPKTTEALQQKQRQIRDIIFSSPECSQEELHNLLVHYQIVFPSMKQQSDYLSLTLKLRKDVDSDDEE